ncbi:MAG: hypothetical protein C5B49_02205 [Bdellovibrio sp.]|nr:MAG: hypothetical protein C5B49_02205 [Bdellovibrio sp.]
MPIFNSVFCLRKIIAILGCSLVVFQAGVFGTSAAQGGAFSTSVDAAGLEGEAAIWHHSVSLIDPPKYGPDSPHFDYVNPQAPKRGSISLRALHPFDNLNFIAHGARLAPYIEILYDRLMEESRDEYDTSYCHLCEGLRYSSDYRRITVRLRPDAHWHDGQPITPEDVMFSIQTYKTRNQFGAPINPYHYSYYSHVKKWEKTGDREVTFYADKAGIREMPAVIGSLMVLPKHYWQGLNDQGLPRDISHSTLEIPLGSGPYQIAEIHPGDRIVYRRVENYWAKNLLTAVGHHNFEEIKFLYFGDEGMAFEGFTSHHLDFFREKKADRWVTGYNFPALLDGRVRKEPLELETPLYPQGYVFNLRKIRFQDRRVRAAIALAFDFEWLNKFLFHDQYQRISSYFAGPRLSAQGLPGPAELEILEPYRSRVPEEVFTKEIRVPVNWDSREGQTKDLRAHLRQAVTLLQEAGWLIKDGWLQDGNGQPFAIDFYITTDSEFRILNGFLKNLAKLGIHAQVWQVDNSRYRKQIDKFDFDIAFSTFDGSPSPGNELTAYLSSESADQPGSPNLAGIKNPVVDALIERIVEATDRKSLEDATRALDRVLWWNQYMIPGWGTRLDRIAYWNQIRKPAKMPTWTDGFPAVWWYDEKAYVQNAGVK